MWYVAHGYFAYVNEISFAYPEHLVHGGEARLGPVWNLAGYAQSAWSIYARGLSWDLTGRAPGSDRERYLGSFGMAQTLKFLYFFGKSGSHAQPSFGMTTTQDIRDLFA